MGDYYWPKAEPETRKKQSPGARAPRQWASDYDRRKCGLQPTISAIRSWESTSVPETVLGRVHSQLWEACAPSIRQIPGSRLSLPLQGRSLASTSSASPNRRSPRSTAGLHMTQQTSIVIPRSAAGLNIIQALEPQVTTTSASSRDAFVNATRTGLAH